ncbi:MAG: hypothetical protein HC878_15325 [Leptolyngbyaceae cyanobacterium SL_5_14]|nr:hypothetical protein [Leptolyngbyaceae cyanobacterium SL_5_14]
MSPAQALQIIRILYSYRKVRVQVYEDENPAMKALIEGIEEGGSWKEIETFIEARTKIKFKRPLAQIVNDMATRIKEGMNSYHEVLGYEIFDTRESISKKNLYAILWLYRDVPPKAHPLRGIGVRENNDEEEILKTLHNLSPATLAALKCFFQASPDFSIEELTALFQSLSNLPAEKHAKIITLIINFIDSN